MEKLIGVDVVAFGKMQYKFDQFSRSKNHPNYVDLNLKVLKKDDPRDFSLVQNVTIGESDFNQILRLSNQLVVAAKHIDRDQNMSPILTTTISRDMEEHLKAVQKVVDIVNRTNKTIGVISLRYKVDKSDSS